jgi:hypothetical protein
MIGTQSRPRIFSENENDSYAQGERMCARSAFLPLWHCRSQCDRRPMTIKGMASPLRAMCGSTADPEEN